MNEINRPSNRGLTNQSMNNQMGSHMNARKSSKTKGKKTK